MKAKKLTLIVCAAVLAIACVAGTIAYFTSSDSTEQVFTVGKVEIELSDIPTTEKLVPAKTYTAAPVVTVKKGSEDAYVFVKLVNGLHGGEKSGSEIETQMRASGTVWTLFTDDGDGNVVYTYKYTSDKDNDKKLPTFTSYTVDPKLDNTKIQAYDGEKIEVYAYAIQAEGFADADAAWAGLGFTK